MVRDRNASWIVLLVLLGCLIMAWVEAELCPVYPIKSAVKVLTFCGCGTIYMLRMHDRQLLACFQKPDALFLRISILLSVGAVVVLLGGYAVLSRWVDFSGIISNLNEKEGITAATFPVVALYISLVNSMLEEFFFRGFAFLTLRRYAHPMFALLFSSICFALYHVYIMDNWFHPALFVLLTLGLVLSGALFNLLDWRGSIWCSWLVHMSANLGINIIGLHLFGVL